MFYQLMPLQWGLISPIFQVSNLKPTSRVLLPIAAGDISKGIAANGVISTIAGRGILKRVNGSGIVKRVKGRGKLCP